MLGQYVAAKTILNVDGESQQLLHMLLCKHEFMPLLLARRGAVGQNRGESQDRQ